VTFTQKMPWSSSGMNPAGILLANKPAPRTNARNIAIVISSGGLTTCGIDIAIRGDVEHFVKRERHSERTTRRFRWLQEQCTQRGCELKGIEC